MSDTSRADSGGTEVDPATVTYAEGQADSPGGGEVQLSDDDITGVLQEYGVTDDSGVA